MTTIKLGKVQPLTLAFVAVAIAGCVAAYAFKVDDLAKLLLAVASIGVAAVSRALFGEAPKTPETFTIQINGVKVPIPHVTFEEDELEAAEDEGRAGPGGAP